MSSLKVYKPPMPKYVATMNHYLDQHRINLPRQLVKDLAWEDVQFITLDRTADNTIVIRRFIDGQSLRSETDPGKHKSD